MSAERRQRAALRFLTRGRADGLVAIALLQRWPSSKTYRVGSQIGVDRDDVRAAYERATAYSEVDA